MEYKLQELVNLNLFQSILESFNGLHTFPTAIIDTDGNFLTSTATDNICSCFHRSNTRLNIDCIQGIQFISDHLNDANPAILYNCPKGLIDCAIPIIIEGRHLGNLIIGQFLPEEPDLVFFRQQASSFGFDEKTYIEAVKRTPVSTQQQLQKYLAIANSIVHLIVDTGTKNLEEIKIRKKIEESEEQFKQLFNTAPDAVFLADTESGIIINANLAAEKLMGKSVQNIIGLHFSDLHPKWNETQTQEAFQMHSRVNIIPDGVSTVENIVLKADGTEVPVEILASTMVVNGQRVIQGIFRDISQRKHIEAQLLTSEEKHRKLAENLPDIVARFDKEFKHLYVNKVVENFTGLAAESFIGKTNEDLNMPEENVKFWNENLKRVFETGKQQNFEFEFHSDDSTHYFSDLLVPEFDNSGKVTSVLSVARDISTLKKSKNNLRVQRDISLMLGEMRNLDQALKNLLDFCYQLDGIDCGGIYLVDMVTGNIDMVSHFGLSKEFVEQNTHFPKNSEENSVFNQETKLYLSFSDLQDSSQKNLLQEKIRSLAILPIIYKGKAIAYFNLASRRFNDIPFDDRTVLESIASNLGGTIQRISTENQLKESETKYKLAFHTSPDAINITSLDGLFLDVSEGFTALLGYTSEEVIGRSTLELNIWANPEDRTKLNSELKKHGKINNLESVFRAKDGSLRTALMSANIIPIHGVPHILMISRDITERKREINDLLIAKEKAEESNRLKTAFLANLSHELRTPMNGILGFAELLNDDSLPKESRIEYISIINDSGQNLLEVITSLMDISKIDSGQIESRIKSFNLNSLLGELFHWFSNEKIMVDKPQLELKVIKPLPDDESNISTDPGKIRHILSLLLKNAAKFSNEGFIHFGYSLHGKRIKFFVQDTGKGIRKDKQDAIFDRFRQEDETMTRKYGGVGLGLTIARGLVQLMGGTIGVDSDLGKGSTFWFEIPLHL